MDQRTQNRLVGADAIRAIATLWVFAGHLFTWEPTLQSAASPAVFRILSAGYMGVAAFFVLSGFLLSMPLWRAYLAGSDMPSLGLYMRRRLARIAPEYYACVLILAVIAGAMSTRWGLMQVASCLTFTNALLPPMYMPAFNAPLWSISIEMSFYLLLPVAMVGMFRLRGRVSAPICLAALTGLIVLGQPLMLWAAPYIERTIGNESLFSATSSSTTKNAVVLFAHFLIGVAAAGLHLSRPLRQTAGRFNRYDATVLAGALVIGGSLATGHALPGLGYMNYQWPTFPAIIGLLLICLPRSAAVGPWLDGYFFRITATLSYGLYIWHIPVRNALKNVWPKADDGQVVNILIFALAALACAYLAATASYVLIGKPALNWMRAREARWATGKTNAATANRTHDDKTAAGHTSDKPAPSSYSLALSHPIDTSDIPSNADASPPADSHQRTHWMTHAEPRRLRISPRSLAVDAYEVDASTGGIEDSLDVIEDLGAYNRWVFDLLEPHVEGRVLEVGCGTGNITQFLTRSADEVVGIDPVERFIDRFRQRFAGNTSVTSHRCTLANLTPPTEDAACFDTVVSCNVFEHIEDHVGALRQMATHLRPGGKAVIFVPAGPIAFGRLDKELGHHRRYTVASLHEAMQDAGLEWVEGRYSNAVGLLGWWFNSVVLRKTTVSGDQAVWFNRLVPVLSRLEKLIRPPFGQSVVGVARKPFTAALPSQQPAEYRRAA